MPDLASDADPDAELIARITVYETARGAIPGPTAWGTRPDPAAVAAARVRLDQARRALELALRRRRSFAYDGKSYFLDSQGDLHIVRVFSVQEIGREYRVRGTPHQASERREHRPAHISEKRIGENY